MARKRMISPEFWTDEKLGECTRDERLLFMGLISNADDEGRGRANVKLVKATVFPYDDFMNEDIEKMMAALAEKRLVYVYVVDGQQFYCLPGFSSHQTINKPTESKIPPMPEEIQLPEYYGRATVELPTKRKEDKLREDKGIKENKALTRTGDIFTGHSFSPQIQDKLTEWLKYKSERRESYKPTGLKSFLTEVENKLKIHTEADIIALIGECMANNWRGIIWDKIKGRASPKNENPYFKAAQELGDG